MLSNIDLNTLCQFQYGIFIVSSFSSDKINGQLASVVFQVTSQPIQIATCINKNNFTHQLIMASKRFGVSILSQDTGLDFIKIFGFRTGRTYDKFVGVKHKTLSSGIPLVLDHASSVLDVKLTQSMDINTHTLFVGELVFAEKLNDKLPMTYNYYYNVLKGKNHKNAPTFQCSCLVNNKTVS